MNKVVENMLINYKRNKIKIKNLKLDLELLENEYNGVRAIGYEEKTGPTNKFNSDVENEAMKRDYEISKLKNKIKEKENEIEKIDNAIGALEVREKKIICMSYFENKSNAYISSNLNLSEKYICNLRKKIIKYITPLIV